MVPWWWVSVILSYFLFGVLIDSRFRRVVGIGIGGIVVIGPVIVMPIVWGRVILGVLFPRFVRGGFVVGIGYNKIITIESPDRKKNKKVR